MHDPKGQDRRPWRNERPSHGILVNMTLFALSLLAVATPRTWCGTPVWRSSTNDSAQLHTIFHTVQITLTAETVTFKTKSLFKNTGDTPLTGSILVPIYGNGEFPGECSVGAKFADASVSTTPGVAETWKIGASCASARGFQVTLAPGSWKSFESTVTRPLPKAGEGNAERLVLYEVMDEPEKLEQFQVAIKYPKKLVFQTLTTNPHSGWQIGETGAWWSAKNWLPRHTVFQFRFFPGTFERIGG